jgi:ABC-type Co2+ transport system permease subunit
MFKKLVPVIALALIAGPVFAADAPATTPGASQSSTAPAKSSHHSKKSHKSSKSSKAKSTTDSSTAPAK